MHPLSVDDMSGMRAGEEGKVKSRLNLETVVCTDTVGPGSRVCKTGHNLYAGGLQYSQYKSMF